MKEAVKRWIHLIVRAWGDAILSNRLILVTGIQVGLVLLANMAAFALRFEGEIPTHYWRLMFKGFPLVGVTFWGFLLAFGVHRGLWRYVGLHDLGRLFGVSVASTVVLYGLIHLLLEWTEYPRSVIILTGLLGGGFLAGIRLTVRWLREWLQMVGPSAHRVLIVGAGNAGELLARDMQSNPAYNYRPVAFVDDDPVKQKAKIHGIPVVGTINDINRAVEQLRVHEIIVSIPSAAPRVLRRTVEAAEASQVPIKTLPTVKQLLDSPVTLRQVRPLRLEDLLDREPIKTDLQELHPLLEGKHVLVTGAGGSIGSELCRQIACYRPALLMLFERHENSLYALDLELRETFPRVRTLAVIGDTTDADRVRSVFQAHAPHLIFHAAAHKHVPMMEQNPREAVRNNVLGTRVIAEAALAMGTDRFVLISTDKAIHPTSVMGATKRIAEYLVQDMNRRAATRFTAVRFGNVLGSNGSVVPLFAEQIRKGGPVTVTDPEIKRFFMTIPEAVQLVLQASVFGRGGEVYVLDMGEQIRIAHLARTMIRLSGHVPDRDIKITYIGLRPGEKLYEELFDEGEQVEPTSHPKIKWAVSRTILADESLARHVRELEALLEEGDPERLTMKLQEMVPSYNRSMSDAAK